jgi:hypothetical protein
MGRAGTHTGPSTLNMPTSSRFRLGSIIKYINGFDTADLCASFVLQAFNDSYVQSEMPTAITTVLACTPPCAFIALSGLSCATVIPGSGEQKVLYGVAHGALSHPDKDFRVPR